MFKEQKLPLFASIVKPKNNATLWKTTYPLLQAGFGTPPSIDVSLIVGFTINGQCLLNLRKSYQTDVTKRELENKN